TWSNSGTISVNGGIVNLGGTTSGVGTFTVTGAQLNIVSSFTSAQVQGIAYTSTTVALKTGGLVDNTGATLTLNATTGSWSLLGGTFKGGTLAESAGAQLVLTSSGGTLDGVTVNGNLDLTSNYSGAGVVNGLTLNGTATLGYFARLVFYGTQTLG